ncbi:diaminohydroxyphosphoribosylaminopyrimidine deaminase [Salsuginibacillus halophilus]|uniref:Riboflavin biosynthesis protein RibD n=1 Tax=Salsuginibacillus halophilus TaxID=517424 RepID=A0A2P8HW54_9BACI|nr:bifunctional diaminohydroxyphosphoribosylaminopyrimidine deaminase/5-amino-6-(5-phosphoribosylamino)uracil reductase RibD [Salsuginibacillus halophilus]PSL50394.1 diaminohydroxyphosphoribosylaminopyrimidine deaminase [Salsuginibacillus halophilus]
MNDETYMRQALDLAASAEGQTAPNPLVGAVVVKDGAVVGVGAHLAHGEAHAEVHALNMAGDKAAGATIYVTLEPCSHHGKTPPCADKVIEAGISRCVVAVQDPFSQVAGNGIQKLRDAGIEVTVGCLEGEARERNRAFFHYVRTGLPYITVKSAASLDGKTSTHTGESQWITSEAARTDGHRLRHTHQAIAAGIDTVIHDDPSLTTRLPAGGNSPIRVIVDTMLRTPLEAKMLHDDQAPVWIIAGPEAPQDKAASLQEAGARIFRLNESPASNLRKVMELLGEEKITSVLVEGGATLIGSFVTEQLVNEWVSYIAPMVIGGREATPQSKGKGMPALADVPAMEIQETTMLGPDVKITARKREE